MLKIENDWGRGKNLKSCKFFSTKTQLSEPCAARHCTNQQEIEPIFGEHFGVPGSHFSWSDIWGFVCVFVEVNNLQIEIDPMLGQTYGD